VFTSWPPDLTTEQLEQLTLLATTYALSHSLLYLPPHSPDKRPPPAPESAIHAPVSLIPAPIPRRIFTQSLNLQRVYNTLYARVALDVSFLDQVMGPGGVSDVDDFTFSLWSAWKGLRDEGVPSVYRTSSVLFCADGQTHQPLHLGLFRSDYMLHQPTPDGSISLKQVEFNTIAASLVGLSQRVAGMHRCVVLPVPFGRHMNDLCLAICQSQLTTLAYHPFCHQVISQVMILPVVSPRVSQKPIEHMASPSTYC